MKEQMSASNEVLVSIQDIKQVTEKVRTRSSDMLTDSGEVAKEMNKLDGLTQVITGSMDEMATGAVQINNAVVDVNELVQKNRYKNLKYDAYPFYRSFVYICRRCVFVFRYFNGAPRRLHQRSKTLCRHNKSAFDAPHAGLILGMRIRFFT